MSSLFSFGVSSTGTAAALDVATALDTAVVVVAGTAITGADCMTEEVWEGGAFNRCGDAIACVASTKKLRGLACGSSDHCHRSCKFEGDDVKGPLIKVLRVTGAGTTSSSVPWNWT